MSARVIGTAVDSNNLIFLSKNNSKSLDFYTQTQNSKRTFKAHVCVTVDFYYKHSKNFCPCFFGHIFLQRSLIVLSRRQRSATRGDTGPPTAPPPPRIQPRVSRPLCHLPLLYRRLGLTSNNNNDSRVILRKSRPARSGNLSLVFRIDRAEFCKERERKTRDTNVGYNDDVIDQ